MRNRYAIPRDLQASLSHNCHASSATSGRVASGPLRPPAIHKPRHGSAEAFHFNERFDEAMTHRRGPTKGAPAGAGSCPRRTCPGHSLST